jgi:hypothetical protein
VECSDFVLQKHFLEELRKSPFHTLIIDESTDISAQEMLILYIKFRPESEVILKIVFEGILKLSAFDSSQSIL